MNLKTKDSSRSATGHFVRIVFSGVIINLIFYGIWYADDQIENCRRSILSLSVTNMTLNHSLSQCSNPPEECRCSFSSNKFNNSVECITDIQAISSHILPPISFLLQLYVMYELLSSTDDYTHIFLTTLWFVAFFILTIIAIGTHGASCFFLNLKWVVGVSGLFQFGLIYYLVICRNSEDLEDEYDQSSRRQIIVKKNHHREIGSQVIVSWPQHYFVILLCFDILHISLSSVRFHSLLVLRKAFFICLC